ncbi:MAG: hypothetical protein GX061_08385 [Eubacteriaceae bacterium]|nr:hypothetical protein [Eubacteriaceae bacterium]
MKQEPIEITLPEEDKQTHEQSENPIDITEQMADYTHERESAPENVLLREDARDTLEREMEKAEKLIKTAEEIIKQPSPANKLTPREAAVIGSLAKMGATAYYKGRKVLKEILKRLED